MVRLPPRVEPSRCHDNVTPPVEPRSFPSLPPRCARALLFSAHDFSIARAQQRTPQPAGSTSFFLVAPHAASMPPSQGRQLEARESALGPTARGASVPSAQPLARARSGASRWSTGIQEQRGRRDRPQPPLQGLRRVFRRLARVIRGRHPLRLASVSFAMACGAAQSTQASTPRQ